MIEQNKNTQNKENHVQKVVSESAIVEISNSVIKMSNTRNTHEEQIDEL